MDLIIPFFILSGTVHDFQDQSLEEISLMEERASSSREEMEGLKKRWIQIEEELAHRQSQCDAARRDLDTRSRALHQFSSRLETLETVGLLFCSCGHVSFIVGFSMSHSFSLLRFFDSVDEGKIIARNIGPGDSTQEAKSHTFEMRTGCNRSRGCCLAAYARAQMDLQRREVL